MPKLNGRVTSLEASPDTTYAQIVLDSKRKAFRFSGSHRKASFVYAICLASMINRLQVEIRYSAEDENGFAGIVKSVKLLSPE